LAVYLDLATVGTIEASDAPKQRRLSRSTCTDEDEEFAFTYSQVKILNCMDVALACGESLR